MTAVIYLGDIDVEPITESWNRLQQLAQEAARVRDNSQRLGEIFEERRQEQERIIQHIESAATG